MARLLFTVTYVSTLTGRGIVLFPKLEPIGQEAFRTGDPLLLKRPDGMEISTKIGSVGLAKPLSGPCEPLVLISELKKEDVPVGTEVWSVDRP